MFDAAGSTDVCATKNNIVLSIRLRLQTPQLLINSKSLSCLENTIQSISRFPGCLFHARPILQSFKCPILRRLERLSILTSLRIYKYELHRQV
jgi:hypothetical protein